MCAALLSFDITSSIVRALYLGMYIKEAEKIKLKEERKVIAGYSSGRKAPETLVEVEDVKAVKVEGEDPQAASKCIPTMFLILCVTNVCCSSNGNSPTCG